MTVGQLAERTGVSRKLIRELEGRGLVYSAGRSESNYRLFDESALSCIAIVTTLRSLGLTLAEIEHLCGWADTHPGESPGPMLATLLDDAQQRMRAQVRELHEALARIEAFRAENAAALAGDPRVPLGPPDPCRRTDRAA